MKIKVTKEHMHYKKGVHEVTKERGNYLKRMGVAEIDADGDGDIDKADKDAAKEAKKDEKETAKDAKKAEKAEKTPKVEKVENVKPAPKNEI